MKTKRDLIDRWINKAEKDLAVEKCLKAYLVFLGFPFAKTHEIGELITKCENKDREISELKEEADRLTDYAVEIRYPEERFEPGLEDAEEAFETAKKVREFILNRIGLINK